MFKKILLSAILLIILTFKCYSQESEVYKIHAMFISNFVKYIEFPSSTSNKVVIGIFDNTDVYKVFEEKFGSSSNQKIIVKNIFNIENSTSCNIIYISSNNKYVLTKVLEKIKNKPIILITEDQNLINKGASVSFKIIDNKMKFQMNKPLMESLGFKIADVLYSLSVK